MPRSVLITTSILVVLAGLGGFWLGQQRVPIENATGVIEAVAKLHVETQGGVASDCVGWLHDAGDVLRVRCGDVRYDVDRMGRITTLPEGGI